MAMHAAALGLAWAQLCRGSELWRQGDGDRGMWEQGVKQWGPCDRAMWRWLQESGDGIG